MEETSCSYSCIWFSLSSSLSLVEMLFSAFWNLILYDFKQWIMDQECCINVLMYLLRLLSVCLWKLKLSRFCGVLWIFIPSLFLPLGKTRLFLLLSFFCIIQLASHLSPSLFLSFPQANLKKFMEYVQQRNVEKVSKFLEKGLDPNFHDPETGGKWHHLYSKVQIN